MNLPIQTLLLSGLIALVAGTAGCTSSRYDQDAYDFDPERSRTRAILNAQYAKGAADDGSLSEHHFDGGRLNGLGRDKLDRMLAAGRGSELVVYVDIAPAPGIDHQPLLQAVRDYLAASGMKPEAGTVVLGPSHEQAFSSDSLAGMHRLRKDNGGAIVGSAPNDVMASQHADIGGGQ